MKLFKRAAGLLLAAVLVLGMAPAALAATPAITIKIDGQTVSSDADPIVISGTTFVPVRVVTEYLGADVSWNQSKQQATVKTAAYTVVFTIGSASYTVNGASKTLPVAATADYEHQRTLIPLRALAESIGAEVEYDANSMTAIVNYFTKMSGSIKVSGSTTVQPIAQAAADKLLTMNSGLSIAVAGGGSGTGIKETTSGANNIGMSSRDLTADEAAPLTPFVIANDGIALIVNNANSIKNLTREQAEKIFLGEITNWKDVGGADAPILVQTRETGSGTLATLDELLLEKKGVVSTATPYGSTELLKQAVAAEKNAIGFISAGYKDATIKVVTLDNVNPTEETISGGTYGLSRSLYVFTKGAPAGVNAVFIDYLRSEACQTSIIEKEGYVPIR